MAITKARRERMARALELRELGTTYESIATQTGVSTRQAYEDVQDALREITREPAESVLAVELRRLDAILYPMTQQARGGDQGAVDRVLRIMDRRAKYLGLDRADNSQKVAGVKSLLEELLGGDDGEAQPEAEAVDPGGDR